MIDIMHSVNKPMNQVEKYLDTHLWHACAGGMVQMPPVNSKIYYFPQGHAEHAHKNVDLWGLSKISPFIPCRVSSIKYLADAETDEVYSKIGLVPLRGNDGDGDDEYGLLGFDKNDEKEKSNSFAKTLTQSDANNGGGFSVPRYCAETIFPRLNYSAEPPVQTIFAKDVHGGTWKFRHIYRGTPRRHLLTTGWSNFVNQKKLLAGDSIVFYRAENGDIRVGIRRAKRGIGGGPEVSSGWNTGDSNSASSMFRGFSGFLCENGKLAMANVKKGNGEMEKVKAESVIEAANLAANGQPFEVVYYPRASTPEFVVRASSVRDAMRVQWYAGMRFKMAFETEDSSRISWFMGTVSSVQVEDPIHWPNSPWRLLQVTWDEPDLLQNGKRVNPWLVELVSNMPAIHLSPFSPPRKRSRLPQPPEFPMVGQLQVPSLLSNTLILSSPSCFLQHNISAGIQGARHAQFGSSLLDLHVKNLQPGLHLFESNKLDNPIVNPIFDSISCLPITVGNSTQNLKLDNETQKPVFLLFGQPILTEQQISQSCSLDNQENTANLSNGSGSAVIQNCPQETSLDEQFPRFKDQKLDFGLATGQCKVFMESEDIGRTLDLSVFHSYEELYKKLAEMFGMEKTEMLSNVLYSDAVGTTKNARDETFSDLMKNAKRLTILRDTGSDNLGSSIRS
ncbi:auxin response factor 18-like [Olea europaea var. sylvestris]|uniref:auxin response factor 18-like n=1 Tax=Olea europaea var. sylvestris TaxID=158386 RepID=UPI000C1D5967|nr:auxin response factor 18-like [Olea europaea var. sylvestris]